MKISVPRLLHRFFRKAGIRIDLLKIQKVYSRHLLSHSSSQKRDEQSERRYIAITDMKKIIIVFCLSVFYSEVSGQSHWIIPTTNADNLMYTIDIPLNCGPYKFYGLPGLILQIEDSAGEYCWSCILIDTHKRPIVHYNYNWEKTDRKKYMKWEADIHRNPGAFMQNKGFWIELFDPQTRQYLSPEAYNWTIPYNPIELE